MPCLVILCSTPRAHKAVEYTYLFFPFSFTEGNGKREPRKSSASSAPVDTARRHIASELLQTEKNFVDILNIIVKVCACIY